MRKKDWCPRAPSQHPILLDQLTGSAVMRQPQNSDQRSYFGKFKRPSAASVLDWRSSATELDLVIRALNVGGYSNFLGSAKIWTGPHAAIVTDAAVEPGSQGSCGEILELSEQKIRIHCADSVLAISGIVRLDGRETSVAEFAALAGLNVGDILPEPNSDALDELTKSGVREEEARTAELTFADVAELPQRRVRDASGARERVDIDIPDEYAAGSDPETLVCGPLGRIPLSVRRMGPIGLIG